MAVTLAVLPTCQFKVTLDHLRPGFGKRAVSAMNERQKTPGDRDAPPGSAGMVAFFA
jgi:hypothetical protein